MAIFERGRKIALSVILTISTFEVKSFVTALTLIRLGFFRVVFSGERVNLTPFPYFIFQEELM